MNNPLLVAEVELSELKDLVDAYPYAPTFVFLYLYKLAMLKDVRYHSELRRYSLLLPDRGRLFRLVEGGEAFAPVPNTEDGEAPSSFDLIDQFLAGKKEEGQDLPTELSYSSQGVSEDYFAWEAEGRQEEQSGNEELSPLLPQKPITSSSEKNENLSPKAEMSEELGESLFTETLARIYIQQERYDKALRIIRSLRLNYPEKNRYFVDQIRFLELLEQRRQLRNNKQ